MNQKQYEEEAKEKGMSIQELAKYRVEIKKDMRDKGISYDPEASTYDLLKKQNKKVYKQ